VSRLSMGQLEAQVMDVLWDSGGWMTPGAVHAVLNDRRPIAYTTVMTVLVRLWKKHRLERERHGRAYAYHPLVSREAFAAARMSQVLAAASDRSAVLSRFLDDLDPAERSQLRALLRRRST
jgi:predicted transcriptional regulator